MGLGFRHDCCSVVCCLLLSCKKGGEGFVVGQRTGGLTENGVICHSICDPLVLPLDACSYLVGGGQVIDLC